MKFYVIRHGETEMNGSGHITGQLDIPLTEKGKLQVAEAVQGLPADIAAIYSSDLIRTKQTTEILNRSLGLPVTYDARLRERSFGSLEGTEWTSFDPVLYEKDQQQEFDYRPYGGESAEDFRNRISACLKDIAEMSKGKPVLIVAHGGVIRLLRHLRDHTAGEAITNGSVHEFEFAL